MNFRKYGLTGAIILLVWGVWLLWLWQPERQVRLHTTHFLQKVERRNWQAAGAFLADDFTDRWGHDKRTALEDARQVFEQFVFLTIENRTDQCTVLGTEGTARTVIKVSGQGGPIGDLVMQKVNGLHEPFVFTWRHFGKAPWKWQLIRVDQSELNIDADNPF